VLVRVQVAVVDSVQQRASEAADEFGAAALTDHRALIGQADAVSVAVPATLHAAVAGDLAKAGIHVLVEKPIAADSASARRLVDRAAEAGVVLQVGHVERFSPAVRELKRRVTEPRRISCVRHAPWSPRSSDVDVVLDLMIHDIDHVLALAGAPLVSVSASGRAVVSDRIDEAEAWLTFANGVVATLSASRVAEESRRRITVTEQRTVYVADLAATRLSVGKRSGPSVETITFPPHDNLGAELAAFLDAIRGNRPVEADGSVGLAAVAVAERIQSAIAEPAIVRERADA
jgi:predicted dehydrogenase